MNLDYLKNKDFTEYPKLRHDLWYSYKDQPEIYHLIVPGQIFEIASHDAKRFLEIRPYCTGHHHIDEISKKSRMPAKDIKKMIMSLDDCGVLHRTLTTDQNLDATEISDRLEEACLTWRSQLKQTYIANDIIHFNSTPNIVKGWMLETYHYIKKFPYAILCGVEKAQDAIFKKFMKTYYRQEKGHETFIEKCLVKMGFTKEEIRTGNSLISTQLIHKQMVEMISYEPLSILPIALMIESLEYDEEELEHTYEQLAVHYGFVPTTFQDFLLHMKIDFQLGHGLIFHKYKHYLEGLNVEKLNVLVNSLHDLKHCFDLQSMEIQKHYGKKGTYMPRQYISFDSI